MYQAHLLLGEEGALREYLHELFLIHKIPQVGNPDILVYSGESLSVDEARLINSKAREKPYGSKRIFILSPARFTPEAQNALLKTLEEPSPDIHFFILAREETHFLPTILSRMQIVRVESDEVEWPDTQDAEKFLSLPLAKRLDFAKKFADKNERSALTPFLDSLLVELRFKKASRNILGKVLNVREFSSDPACMPRLILEHLSVVL